MADRHEKSPEEIWQEFWLPILTRDENGEQYDFEPEEVFSLDQLKKELADYYLLLEAVPKVYCEVTGGRISKPNTDPYAVIDEAEDRTQEVINDALWEAVEWLRAMPVPDEPATDPGPVAADFLVQHFGIYDPEKRR